MTFEIDKIRRATGWEPELIFVRAVERAWRWYASVGLPDTPEFGFDFEDELTSLVDERRK